MDECPHCGKPIEEDAESCHHCGSDFETGWKPDVDYYALELPGDDLDSADFPPERQGAGWETFLGPSLVITAAGVFVAAGAVEYKTTVVPFVLFLFVCLYFFYHMVTPKKRTRA